MRGKSKALKKKEKGSKKQKTKKETNIIKMVQKNLKENIGMEKDGMQKDMILMKILYMI